MLRVKFGWCHGNLVRLGVNMGVNPARASGAGVPTATKVASLLDPCSIGPPGLHPPRAHAPSLLAVLVSLTLP